MDTNDELDIDKLIQAELDALILDESIDDLSDDDQTETDTKEVEDEQILNETSRDLEREMNERLAAFENEVKVNLDRYEIDYSEIDELLQKPIGENDNDIQTNVARECGIEREELDRILQSINAEELPLDTTIDSDSNESDDQKIEIVKQNIETIDTVESIEPTPREQEDPNKKLHDERLAESHRRMLDELAVLEQRRHEEEERYAIVLQEQQVRLAEEYRRLQETHDESVRLTRNEKFQFEALCHEQERVTNERRNKMAIIIQSWYRGNRIYRQYHTELIKRVAPVLKSLAKKRKKKEQIELANTANAAKIQQVDSAEKDNHQITLIPLPSSNRVSSPLVDVVTKQSNQVQKLQPLPVAGDSTKKKKSLLKQTSNTSLPSTQIVQLENAADFIPTIFPEERNISSPRTTSIENNNKIDVRRTSSPVQIQEQQRPKSSNKRQHLAKNVPTQMSVIASNRLPMHEDISTSRRVNMIPIKSNNTHIPARTKNLPTIITRSNTFDKNIESLISPSIENTSVADSITRSKTFDRQTKNLSTPSIENSSVDKSIDTTPTNRSNTFVSKFENALPPIENISPIKSTDIIPTLMEKRSDIFINPSESISSPPECITPIKSNDNIPAFMENKSTIVSSSDESIPVIKSIDILPINLSTSLKQSETIPVKPDRPSTPRISTPRKASLEENHSSKATYPFLNEARRWAEHTRDITYSNLIRSTEEIIQQIPTRKTGATLRKLSDIDSQILTKAAKKQPPKEVRYLLLEQLLTPYSFSLIGTTFPNLTHLILRQCKLVQLSGLDSCSSLTILDIQGNWLEQIHIQNTHLKYLNISRNRLTSLLSIQTPRLKYLDVSKNRLTRLNGIETLSNLNILLATSNQLLTTIGLQGCTHLLHIDVSDNHLVEMEQLEQCPLLITIKATSNALIQIPNLCNAILLNELDLSSNSLTSFDELSIGSWLPFLTHLRLSSNNLQELSTIKLPSLIQLDLAFNQLSDVSVVKGFIKACPLLSRINLEQNPVVCDIKDALITEEKSLRKSISILPQSSTDKSSESIQLYLDFLSNITSMFIKLRRVIEQYQIDPFHLLKSIHHQCQQYYEQNKIEIPEVILPIIEPEIRSPDEQPIIRLQAHWRRRLIERKLNKNQQAAQRIQARWRGYAVRQRMRTVRRLFSQQHQTFDEIDLTQFDFDEAAFDARLQRPRTPIGRIRNVWQSQNSVLSKPSSITELPRPNSSRSLSAASSRAKPIIEPLDMSTQPHLMTNEWGFTPSSSTAALMLKRAQKMKWNAERRHKRQNMDAYQRLQMARNNEQPPGSLRLARRKQSVINTTKPIVHTKPLSPPSISQSRPNRVYEWVHTQVARFDDSSSVNNNHSPRYERKRLPSLDGSTDSINRMRPSEVLQQQQQQQNRWTSSTMSMRQPPPLLPPINGQIPRV